MPLPLSPRVVLVTGAGARVGAAIARALGARGASVAVHRRTSVAGAAAVVREIEALGGVAAEFGADLALPEQCRGLVEAVVRRFGRLDAIVQSASSFLETPLASTTAEQWDAIQAVNVRAPFLLAQAALPYLREARPGRIVHVGDAMARHPRKDWIAHSVSKAALAALSRALAKALAPEVLVNAVVPGPVLMAEGTTEAQVKTATARVPLGRVGAPEDVALAVAFLLEGAEFVTGAEVCVDGGRDAG